MKIYNYFRWGIFIFVIRKFGYTNSVFVSRCSAFFNVYEDFVWKVDLCILEYGCCIYVIYIAIHKKVSQNIKWKCFWFFSMSMEYKSWTFMMVLSGWLVHIHMAAEDFACKSQIPLYYPYPASPFAISYCDAIRALWRNIVHIHGSQDLCRSATKTLANKSPDNKLKSLNNSLVYSSTILQDWLCIEYIVNLLFKIDLFCWHYDWNIHGGTMYTLHHGD